MPSSEWRLYGQVTAEAVEVKYLTERDLIACTGEVISLQCNTSQRPNSLHNSGELNKMQAANRLQKALKSGKTSFGGWQARNRNLAICTWF